MDSELTTAEGHEDGERPIAAFFDLDKTLLLVNSGQLWFRRERAEGRLPLHHAIEAGVWLQLYKLGLMNGRTALSRAVQSLKGELEQDLRDRTQRFFDDEIASEFAPGTETALMAHRQAGHQLVLLTSASLYLSQLVQERLNLDDILCMEFEVEAGRLTGAIQQLCFGDAKVGVAEQWASTRSIDLKDCFFYSDSITDLPMLDRVGRPVAVHPDARLAKLARQRSWPILDWSQPVRAPAATLGREATVRA
ncbi:MAG: HAD-IB family hydrolase [Deltaproteobacteria bacterium]|nr:HAD-IB family hydrolase [Deltaproteobacteria bacterium]|tara:strand:- start:62 stop:811 length:750 start_codon:yes stop_codon:yes gene_type:complete